MRILLAHRLFAERAVRYLTFNTAVTVKVQLRLTQQFLKVNDNSHKLSPTVLLFSAGTPFCCLVQDKDIPLHNEAEKSEESE
jgi:hypothetical protein